MSPQMFDIAGLTAIAPAHVPTPAARPRPRFDEHLETARTLPRGADSPQPVAPDEHEAAPNERPSASPDVQGSTNKKDASKPYDGTGDEGKDARAEDEELAAVAAAEGSIRAALSRSPRPVKAGTEDQNAKAVDSEQAQPKKSRVRAAKKAVPDGSMAHGATAADQSEVDAQTGATPHNADKIVGKQQSKRVVEGLDASAAQAAAVDVVSTAAVAGEPTTRQPRTDEATVGLNQTPAGAEPAGDVEPSGRKTSRGKNAAGPITPHSPLEQSSSQADEMPDVAGMLTTVDADEGGVTKEDAQNADETRAESEDQNDARQPAPPTIFTLRNDAAHDSAGRSDGLIEADRVRFIQRVAKAFHRLGDEGGEVRLRLSPPELGSLRVELTVREGMLTAHLETETTTARSLLLDNLPALRDRLAEQNIKVEKFHVDVREEHRQSAGEQFAGQTDLSRQGHRQRQRQFDQGASIAAARTSRATIKGDGTGELNVVI
jgi:flagellar hook-length control protein FliK